MDELGTRHGVTPKVARYNKRFGALANTAGRKTGNAGQDPGRDKAVLP